MTDATGQDLIAIVGMAGRFPGARDVQGFWANLCAGVESIRTFTDAELAAAGADLSAPGFVPRGSAMDGVELFDAPFFGMSPREAELTDPQHRVFLESAWTAIEHAGYDPGAFDGRIGVFGGVSPNTYFRNNVSGHRDLLARVGEFPQVIASEREHAITRVAYKLGLRGPAVSVSTASSTSAVAIHLAVGSLLLGECDMAIAGGCRVRVPTTAGYVYQDDGIASPDGHCRPFDAQARGTVLASGVAIVILRRLQDAIDDGDRVYAVIRGSSVNNDGPDKIGYTAPSVDGQAAVIAEALDVAQVNAETIGMVEAHGTGTALGDPIEIMALTRAYRPQTDRRQYCAIGSLKSNVGHIDAAAGAAGIIKAALSLHHELIPPSINFTTPNPQIDFANSPFFVNTELRSWKRSGEPRRATVSSFGLGGTNAHLVLEEAPLPRDSAGAARPSQVLVLSAKTPGALEHRRRDLANHLEAQPHLDLPDAAFTLGAGRARMPHRQAIVASSAAAAVQALRAPSPRETAARVSAVDGVGVAFLFPGQGAQHLAMGAGLYEHEPAFTTAMDECADVLGPIIGLDLRDLLYGEHTDSTAAGEALAHAGIAQPATFAMSYAVARLWMSWGIQPSAMIGHSMGEFVAACLGGVFSLEDALALIAERGRLSQELHGGRMLSVLADPGTVTPFLDGETSIAAINTPTLCVASGPDASITALEERLRAGEIETRPLPIEHAAHSAMVEPIMEAFRARVAAVARSPLRSAMVSTVTGDWATDERVMSPDYWADHLRATVRFSDAAGRLLERSDLVLLEVGAGQTLTTLARRHPTATNDRTIVASLRHLRSDTDDQAAMMRTLGQLWTAGVDIDWSAVHGGPRRRAELPTYPFDHARYWIEPVTTTPSADASPSHDNAAEPTDGAAAEVTRDSPNPPAATAAPEMTGADTRVSRIAAELTEILADLSGLEASSLDRTASFSDLGFDSLFLTQANSQFRKRFGIGVTFRQLFEEAPTVDALAAFIDARLAPEAFPAPAQASIVQPAAADPRAVVSNRPIGLTASEPAFGASDVVQRVIDEQLRIMEKQLDLLRTGALQSAPPAQQWGAPAETAPPAQQSGAPADTAPPAPRRRHYLATGDQQGEGQGLDERQKAAIADLVRRYNARTSGSKRLAQRWRPRVADNRTIVGFDVRWKELVYQIVSERSKGSRIWDVDGNEYVDTALGFGTDLLGHSPDFVVKAVHEQLDRGYEVGVQNHLLGEVSEMICEATAHERVTYATSGGEAVVSAIRIARTSTGRDKVAYFRDSIHGRNDVVLGRAVESQGRLRSMPLVAGVPQRAVDDTLVLEYGTDRALQEIAAAAGDLALVLVEPVQSRHPDLQPVEFLRQLRRLADEHGFLLVFDEVVSGFRAHRGGVQALFDIRADLTTYGKIVGGGLPIGVVAGRSKFIDVVDGGPWAFGDDSFPEADITASGGTLIKHPLTLAATRAILAHLEESGPSLQSDLNRRTSEAVHAINDGYARAGLPIHVEHFSSYFRPNFSAAPRFAGLFEFYLREQGIHMNPPSPSFLSTVHTEADIEAVVAGYLTAGQQMAGDGFLEPVTAALPRAGHETTSSALPVAVPVLPNVARFLIERETPGPSIGT